MTFARSHISFGEHGFDFTSKDEKSIAIADAPNATHVAINLTLTSPLIIDGKTKNALSLTFARNARAHVVLDAREISSTSIKLDPYADAHIYVKGTQQELALLNIAVHEDARATLFVIGVDQQINLATDVELLGRDAAFAYFALDFATTAKTNSALTIFHRVPHTKSAQAFRGIYGGASRGQFLGKVVIDKGARASNAAQLYKSILLSKDAKAHVMPQLEINNHDVAATHGASIGELDSTILFYLCSRGIKIADAKALMMMSMANDILDNIDDHEIKASLSEEVAAAISACEDAHVA